MRDGNKVEPLIHASAFFERLCNVVDSARHSVWLTVAFLGWDFLFPDGRGFFDVLDQATARGVDVRLLVWRPNPEAGHHPIMFRGTQEDRDRLLRRSSRIKIRWDCAIGRYCQHQKSWLIDAGFPSEIAFVGGANITLGSSQHHDVYLNVAGPSASDVHHNFVQRWNEASERHAEDGNWQCDVSDRLAFPGVVSQSSLKKLETICDLDLGASVSILPVKSLRPSVRAVIVVLALSLGACRDYLFEGNNYSAPMTVNRIKRLYEARDACLAKNAIPADTANSDVASTAKAVSLSCAPETDRLIIASNPDRDPKVAAAIRNDTNKRAMLYVMRARR